MEKDEQIIDTAGQFICDMIKIIKPDIFICINIQRDRYIICIQT